jgi:sigma-B regulation protein RsbU (phosphoserine phosphatase)
MATTPVAALARDELLERRRRLETALTAVADPAPLRQLLHEVDETLDRIEQGTFGLCSVCHDPIEADRLAADPLLRNCIDHLTPAEQRALERDLDLSSRVQSALLPARELRHGEWEIIYHYEPFGAVSGDYCDVLTSADGQVHVLVGDVAGKGVAASLLMAYLHATFRSLVPLGLGVSEMVERANHLFCESTGGRSDYATLACVRASQEGEVEILNAGHCPPLHLSATGAARVPPSGLPLGLFCSSPYSTNSATLASGDTLLLYTDGLSEARDRSDQEFGEERLVRAAQCRQGAPLLELVQGCLDELATFRDGVACHDDLTLLALRRVAG